VSEARSFDGTLVTVPFATGALRDALTEQYRQLLDSYDSEEILVITGTPTSMRTFRAVLDREVPGAGVPRVTSLVVQATDVVDQTDDRAVLSDDMQRELVHRFLEEYEWDTDYLRRASAQPSFEDDMAKLMETATWQDAPLDETPELTDIANATEAFHAWLADHDYLERGQLISEATAAFHEADDTGPIVDANAVLAVEFEEFLPPDRASILPRWQMAANSSASRRRTRASGGRGSNPDPSPTTFRSHSDETRTSVRPQHDRWRRQRTSHAERSPRTPTRGRCASFRRRPRPTNSER